MTAHPTLAPARARPRADLTTTVLLVVAAAQLLPGVIALVAPGAFYDLLAPYPPENAHLSKDLGAWQIALGAAALLAARRPDWRAPMLAVLALQYGLHTISHVIDVGGSDPAWNGPAVLTLQALATLVLLALLLKERRP
ncbi:MAG TPA: DUF4345 family protein [Solirubrobacteraceae bacterium]|nr:DUF4345 family protein [Solirubrobacteraceae bacterium]